MTKAELRMMTDDELATLATLVHAEQDERYRAAFDRAEQKRFDADARD